MWIVMKAWNVKKKVEKNYRDEVAFASVLSVLRLLLPMFKSSRILSAE
jgi:hypothetical protein